MNHNHRSKDDKIDRIFAGWWTHILDCERCGMCVAHVDVLVLVDRFSVNVKCVKIVCCQIVCVDVWIVCVDGNRLISLGNCMCIYMFLPSESPTRLVIDSVCDACVICLCRSTPIYSDFESTWSCRYRDRYDMIWGVGIRVGHAKSEKQKIQIKQKEEINSSSNKRPERNRTTQSKLTNTHKLFNTHIHTHTYNNHELIYPFQCQSTHQHTHSRWWWGWWWCHIRIRSSWNCLLTLSLSPLSLPIPRLFSSLFVYLCLCVFL